MSSGDGKKKTACVTGGNGYIASALIKVLLEKRYAVKTTVRNPGWSLFSFLFLGSGEISSVVVAKFDSKLGRFRSPKLRMHLQAPVF
jgi:anthocyanidin reductase